LGDKKVTLKETVSHRAPQCERRGWNVQL